MGAITIRTDGQHVRGRYSDRILAGVFGGALGLDGGGGTGVFRFGEHPLGFLEVCPGHLHLKFK